MPSTPLFLANTVEDFILLYPPSKLLLDSLPPPYPPPKLLLDSLPPPYPPEPVNPPLGLNLLIDDPRLLREDTGAALIYFPAPPSLALINADLTSSTV